MGTPMYFSGISRDTVVSTFVTKDFGEVASGRGSTRYPSSISVKIIPFSNGEYAVSQETKNRVDIKAIKKTKTPKILIFFTTIILSFNSTVFFFIILCFKTNVNILAKMQRNIFKGSAGALPLKPIIFFPAVAL